MKYAAAEAEEHEVEKDSRNSTRRCPVPRTFRIRTCPGDTENRGRVQPARRIDSKSGLRRIRAAAQSADARNQLIRQTFQDLSPFPVSESKLCVYTAGVRMPER